MDARTLETVGRIVGLAGAALGTFLILFREVIRRSILRALSERASHLLVRWSIVLAWSVGMAGNIVWVYETSTTTQRTRIYEVRITVLDPQGVPVEDAEVWSSVGGEPKKVAGGWEFAIPGASKPMEGKFFAVAKNSAFLTGKAELILSDDHNPAVVIHLRNESVAVRGHVVDKMGRGIVMARVFVVGYEGEAVLTQEDGTFQLPAHTAAGQAILLHAEKSGSAPTNLWHPAGDVPVFLVLEK